MRTSLAYDIKRIFGLLEKEKNNYVISVVLCAITVQIFELTIPWVIKLMINAVEMGDARYLVSGFTAMSAVLVLYSIVIPITAFNYEGRSHKPMLNIRLRLLQHLMLLPFKFYQKQHSGELMCRLTGDIDELFDFYKGHTYDVVATLLKGIGASALLFLIDTNIAIIVIGLGFLGGMCKKYMVKALEQNSADMRKLVGESNSILTDSLSGMKVIKTFNMTKALLDGFIKVSNNMVQKDYEKTYISIRRDALNYIVNTINFLGVVSIGAYMVSLGRLDVGSVFAAVMLRDGIVEMFSNLGSYLNGAKIQLSRSARIFDLFEGEEEELKNLDNQGDEVNGEDLIRISNGSFSYGEDQGVLSDINIKFRKNEFIVLLGQSGTGKSTLLKILTGLLDLDSGDINLYGEKADISSLRNNVSYVPQQPYLFSGTILENLKIANPRATLEEVYEVSKKASAHDFIMEQPQGYNTKIGERGCTLSGGQIQRIAIARALLKKSSILILDEGTSAIDSETEKAILENLALERLHRTIFVVAHRGNVAKYATRIISMEKGKIVSIV